MIEALVARLRTDDLRCRLIGSLAQHALPELRMPPHPLPLKCLERIRLWSPCGRIQAPGGNGRIFLLLGKKLVEALRHGVSRLEHGLHCGILIGGGRHPGLLKKRA